MSEDVNKNNDNDSKKLWLWLLLLLLLIIFVLIAVIMFFRDSGTADALDNTISNEIVNGQDGKNQLEDDNDEEDTTSNVVAVVNTADKKVVIASPGVGSATNSGTTVQKQTVKVNIDDESYFNEPVVLEIAGNEYTATITDSDGNTTKYSGKTTISEDGTYTLTIKETDGNETTVTFVVDTTAPEIKGVEEKLYNTEVSPEVEEINLEEVALTKDGSEVEHSLGDAIGEDGEYTLKVTDKAGNEASISFAIDRTAPTYTVEYSITEPTNQDVVATITANEPIQEIDGWTKVSDTTYTKTYSENVEENVTIKDLVGNPKVVDINVTNIDKELAVITVQNAVGKDPRYSKLDFVFSDNRLLDKYVINGNEVDFSDNQFSNANYDNMKAYLVEGENTIKLYDKAGNETVKTFTMDWTAPIATNIEYSTQELTNGNVVVTITATEALYGHPGWSVAGRAYKIKKTFTENAEETVILMDKAGNKTPVTVNVTNIDRVPAVISVQSCKGTDPYFSEVSFAFSDNRLLDKYVINGNEVDFSDNQFSNANYGNMRAYLIEGENTIKLYDKAGNETVKTFTMDWTAPVITVEGFMRDFTVDSEGNWDAIGGERLTSNEDVIIVNESALVSVNGSAKEFEIAYSIRNSNPVSEHWTLVVVRDRAGNETTMIDTDGDGGIYIPEYSTQTTTLSSTPLRMVKSTAPKATIVQSTTPVVEEDKEDDNVETTPATPVVEEDKEDDNVETTPATPVVEEDKEDDNVETTPATPVVEEDKEDNNVETTPATPVVEEDKEDDNVETTPATPVVEEDKEDDNVETTPATPVVEEGQNNDNGVDEEVVLTPEQPVAEEVMNPIVTDSEITE